MIIKVTEKCLLSAKSIKFGIRSYNYNTEASTLKEAILDIESSFDTKKVSNSQDDFEEECIDNEIIGYCIIPDEDYISNYNKRSFRGKEIYFTNCRIKSEDKVVGYNYYKCRGGDDDTSRPCTIETYVWGNFAGSVISKEPLEFDEVVDTMYGTHEYVLLTEEEIDTLVNG